MFAKLNIFEYSNARLSEYASLDEMNDHVTLVQPDFF